ncbi:MAG: ABC transporter substrate-binding protein [Symbiobacteriaceae bacterium]|nr:ABC transporter substrate-binding protein [Symbiobacteriaceae bacterium]
MKRVALIIITAMLLAGCNQPVNPQTPSGTPVQELSKVSVILDYLPNTNHTGLYVALEKGYYTQEGLSVEILQPSEGATATLIATGKGTFGVSYQEDVIYALAAEDPLPIRAIAAIIQHNTSGFASYAPKGIDSVTDFEGKVYAGWGSPAEEAVIQACMERASADFSKLRLVSTGEATYPALQSNVDIIWIYYAWHGVQAEQDGFPLTYLPLIDLHPALDYYTPVLIASEEVIAANPEMVSRFLAATARGYQDCVDDPPGSAAILAKHIPEYDPTFLEKSQEWLAPRYIDDAPRWGEMRTEVWDSYTAFMVEAGLITTSVASDRAFSNAWLP